MQCVEGTIPLCRQSVVDLLDAAQTLLGMNPWKKAEGKRLRLLATAIRDALDSLGAPELPPEERTPPK